MYQASGLLSISEHYPAQHSTRPWFSINFRAIYIPTFIEPMIFYQLQSIIQPSIQQDSDLISISEQHTSQNSSSLWYSINFRALSRPYFNKPLILYQFQNNIQPIIHQASDLLSISENYPAQHSTSLWSSINFRAKYSPAFIKHLIFYQFKSII